MSSGCIHETTFVCREQLLFPLLKTFFIQSGWEMLFDSCEGSARAVWRLDRPAAP